jgi:hypothetical protein
MAGAPEPDIDIVDRESAFRRITQLQKKFIAAVPTLLPGMAPDVARRIKEGLDEILVLINTAHSELQVRFAAPPLTDTLQVRTPLRKAGDSALAVAAQRQKDAFEASQVATANTFVETLQKSRLYPPEILAKAEAQREVILEELARLKAILNIRKSPMKYLTLLAKSRAPTTPFLTIGSTKFYMGDKLPDKNVDTPRFKDVFFKDLDLTKGDDKLTFEKAKSIFAKVFQTKPATPLEICDKDDVDILKQGLENYLKYLREELIKKQGEQGPNSYTVRALLAKADAVKKMVDTLWERQQKICSVAKPVEEPVQEFGEFGMDEIQRILRKVVLILAAKQKSVPGYQHHAKLADKLLQLLRATAEFPDVRNANFPAINAAFGSTLSSSRMFDAVYRLSKMGPEAFYSYVEKFYCQRTLIAMVQSIRDNANLSDAIKKALVEGIDTSDANRDNACTLLETLMKNITNNYGDLLKRYSELELRCKNIAENLAEIERLRGQVAGLQRQLEATRAALAAAGGGDAALAARAAELEAANAELNRTIEGLRGQLEEQRAASVRLAEQIAVLQGELREARAARGELERARDEARRAQAAAEGERDRATRETAAVREGAAAARNAAVREAQEKARLAAEAAAAAHTAAIGEKDATIAGLTADVARITGELRECREQLEAKTGEARRYEEELGRLRPEALNLRARVEAAEGERDELRRQITLLNELLKKLIGDVEGDKTARVNEVEAELERLRKLEKAIVEERAAATNAATAAANRIAELEASLRTCNSEKAAIIAKRDEFEALLRRARDELEGARRDAREAGLREGREAAAAELRTAQDAARRAAEEAARKLTEAQEAARRAAEEAARKLVEAEAAARRAANASGANVARERARADAAAAAQAALLGNLGRAAGAVTGARVPENIDGVPPFGDPGRVPIQSILDRVRALLAARPAAQGGPAASGPAAASGAAASGAAAAAPRQQGGQCAELTPVNPYNSSNPRGGNDYYRVVSTAETQLRAFPFCLNVSASKEYSKSDLQAKATANVRAAKDAGFAYPQMRRQVQVNNKGNVVVTGGNRTRKAKKTSSRTTTQKNKPQTE